jgi:hypothetical protein
MLGLNMLRHRVDDQNCNDQQPIHNSPMIPSGDLTHTRERQGRRGLEPAKPNG